MPSYITSMFSVNNGIHQTHTSDWITCKVPKVFTELGKSAFSYSAPVNWNTLQEHLNSAHWGHSTILKL